MIDRKKLNDVLDVVDKLPESTSTTVNIYHNGVIEVNTHGKTYGTTLTPEERRACLSLLTPLVGKLDKKTSYGTDIDFVGEKDGLKIRLNRVEVCKIVGYKINRVPKMVAVEGETEEDRQTITDCDLKSGRFQESDIDVTVSEGLD